MGRLMAMCLGAVIAGGAALGAPLGAGRAADPKPAAATLKVHMISGSREYQSEPSLKAFKEYLEKRFPIACTLSLGQDGGSDLPGLEAMDAADLLIIFCRRQKVPQDQLDRVKKWFEAGKPALGIRTSSHAFQGWLEMDKAIFGGSYRGHGSGEEVQVRIEQKNKDHPILAGVQEWVRPGKLYHNAANAEDTVTLLAGTGQKSKQTEPIAWCRVYDQAKDARCFYTSMGYPHDFENENFKTLLTNAIYWATKRQKP